jgi:hypothetical protein
VNEVGRGFDLIFFHDTLEHLPREQCVGVLEKLHTLLAPGGCLNVRVPNMSCLLSNYCANIDFTHITNFTEFSMLQVLEAAGFHPEKIQFVKQAPRLFWSWNRPHRTVLRLLNRMRWHLNNYLHRSLFLLWDMHPKPRVFDCNLSVLAEKEL